MLCKQLPQLQQSLTFGHYGLCLQLGCDEDKKGCLHDNEEQQIGEIDDVALVLGLGQLSTQVLHDHGDAGGVVVFTIIDDA